MTRRAILYWSGYGWNIADEATQTEHAGPFATRHLAWKAADAEGFEVVDVMTTRGHIKSKPREETRA